MGDLAVYHPVVVHFTIGFLVAGVLFRWIALTGRVKFAGGAAAVLLLGGTLAAVLAVKSGDDAHGPAERVPGAVEAVVEHEEWGERTRNIFLVVAVLELAALVGRRRRWARPIAVASAVVCAPALFSLYEAGEHGGELVYSYAGGVGVRTGAPEDVGRLLIAATYHQAQADRKAGRPESAAALIEHTAGRFPSDPAVQAMRAESALLDRKDPDAALAILGRMSVPPEDTRMRVRYGMLATDALEAAGRQGAARVTLQQLLSAFPDNARVRRRLEQMPPP